jgi:hypothetical protein
MNDRDDALGRECSGRAERRFTLARNEDDGLDVIEMSGLAVAEAERVAASGARAAAASRPTSWTVPKAWRCGGWGGIRTHEPLAGLAVFKTAAFNHSATHPRLGIATEQTRLTT